MSMIATPEERERGYRAAAIIVKDMLDSAAKDLPKRCSWKHQKLARYREGYHAGLLAAHCMQVLGQFPLVPQNANTIAITLTEQDAEASIAKRAQKA